MAVQGPREKKPVHVQNKSNLRSKTSPYLLGDDLALEGFAVLFVKRVTVVLRNAKLLLDHLIVRD